LIYITSLDGSEVQLLAGPGLRLDTQLARHFLAGEPVKPARAAPGGR
jgi:hypothetical protein